MSILLNIIKGSNLGHLKEIIQKNIFGAQFFIILTNFIKYNSVQNEKDKNEPIHINCIE